MSGAAASAGAAGPPTAPAAGTKPDGKRDKPTGKASSSCDDDVMEEDSIRSYDAVKTYCTEGTPFDTPFVVSSAASMNDLRAMPEKSDTEKVTKEQREEDDEHHGRDEVIFIASKKSVVCLLLD